MLATVLKSPAGLGKTHAIAHKIAMSARGRFEVYVPTHRLAEEWRDLIHRFNPLKRVTILYGRSHLDSAGAPLCQMSTAAENLSQAGFSVFDNLCKMKQAGGLPPLKCKHFDTCKYIQQFVPAEVHIYTHAHLPLERGVLEQWQPSVVVIDESFFQNCIASIKFNIALLNHPSVPAAAQALCTDVAEALNKGTAPILHARMAKARSGGELAAALRALARAQPHLMPNMSWSQRTAALNENVSLMPLRTLLDHLDAELTRRTDIQSVDVDRATGEVTLHHRRPITRFDRHDGSQPKIVILDASASEAVIEQFFEIERFDVQHVKRQAHVVQCRSTRCSTTSLVPTKNGDPASQQAARRRLNEIEAFISRQAADGERVLVVGPTAVVGNPRTGAAALLAVPAKCELAHFNAVRGVDGWKDFDCIVLIGRNEPPVTAVEDMARALFFDQDRTLKRTGNWEIQPRGYRIASAPLGVDVNVHADPRVQAVVEQVRENESLQAIDRLRLVHSDKVKKVFILSNIPLDIDVDETRTWDELMNGTRLERAWGQLNGVLPLSPALLAERFPDLWSTAAAAKSDVSGAVKRGVFSNSLSIRNLVRFEFKSAKQRRWSLCVSNTENAESVQRELVRLTGHPVTVRRPGL